MVAEIASKWVADGTAIELVDWQRAALHRRHAIAAELLAGLAYRSHPESLHVWLPLPGDPDRGRLRLAGSPAGRSDRSRRLVPHLRRPWQPAVRISLGSTTEEELRAGLGTVARLLQGEPEHLLLAI